MQNTKAFSEPYVLFLMDGMVGLIGLGKGPSLASCVLCCLGFVRQPLIHLFPIQLWDKIAPSDLISKPFACEG